MSNQFFPAPEVEEMARDIIREHHSHLLKHNVRVEFIFCSVTPKKNGKQVLGTAQKVGGKTAFFVHLREAKNELRMNTLDDSAKDKLEEKINDEFFLITISRPVWNQLKKHPDKRRALIDHELMHCKSEIGDDGETRLYTVGHDFEGFREEIDRHGLWHNEAREMAKVMSPQMNLPLEENEIDRDLIESVTFKANGQSVTLGRKAPAVAH